MKLNIEHGIINSSQKPCRKKCGVIFNNSVVITTGSILESCITPISGKDFNRDWQPLFDKLKKFEILNGNNVDMKFVTNIPFQITYDEGTREKTKQLSKKEAKILYVFYCKEIWDCLSSIYTTLGKIDIGNEIEKILLSSFVILNVVVPNQKDTQATINRCLKNLAIYANLISPAIKLQDVLTICTPFGIEAFYKTVHFGKISNVLGKRNSIFTISNVLSEGCEGSAVFNNKLELLGLIACTTLYKEDENFNLALVASFQCIFKNVISQCGNRTVNLCVPWKYSPLHWEKCMVLIIGPVTFGTGTFVKISGKKFILTCSHVLDNANNVKCRYIDGCIETIVLWKNKDFNKPYDVAILSVSSRFIPDDYFVKMSNKQPKLGQVVFSAGFPCLIGLEKDNFNPSIFEGRIIKCSSGIIISNATVQAGQSGGPLLDHGGDIIGVCVSNVKYDKIYPQINCAVPIAGIKEILEKYVETSDVKVLEQLMAPENIKRQWNLESSFTHSKL